MTAELVQMPRRVSGRQLDRIVRIDERRSFASNVRHLGSVVRYGAQYDPPVAEQAGSALIYLADRELARLGGDAA
jgi:hypothetical protein